MYPQNQWSLHYPLEDDQLSENTLNIRRRGTSGAGQFELAGLYKNAGQETGARDLVGKEIGFELRLDDGSPIRLSQRYPVNEVGGKVRIAVQDENEKRPNISNLFAALLLLPETSQKGKSESLAWDGLGARTFWIDDIDVTVLNDGPRDTTLLVQEIVLATGHKERPEQFQGAMRLDWRARIETLRDTLEGLTDHATDSMSVAAQYYLDVLHGRKAMDYDLAEFLRKTLCAHLSECGADGYAPEMDPLPWLMKLSPAAEKWQPVPPAKPLVEPHNLIYFGAPGTGKSFQMDKLAVGRDGEPGLFDRRNVRRVMFHPDYTYAQFVGTYKPYSSVSEDGTRRVSYKYTFGPFLDAYVAAMARPDENHLLMIEEINRANPAAVFGDVFQLLDRGSDGASEYPVTVPEDMGEELYRILTAAGVKLAADETDEQRVTSLSLPGNLYLWATMNSADQGVFPMDTAFKRRWDFRYMGIDEGEAGIADIEVAVGERKGKWNDLRHALNERLIELGVNEDKLLGPYFLKPDAARERFVDSFEDKVLLYLYEDAAKMRRPQLFGGRKTYSTVCRDFREHGDRAFEGIDVFEEYVEVWDDREHGDDAPQDGEE